MNKLITLLFCFSIILINPFGLDRGMIWSQPKILAVELITITNLFIISHFKLYLFKAWKIVALLWTIFLLIGAIATINSLEPMQSLLGHSIAKDGLLYWALIAAFTLSNALVLKLKPDLGRSQLQGLVIGGVILGISTFPQIANWKIDYTVNWGNLIADNILQSGVFQGHQPIGLYSHRGFASFVLTAVEILAFVGWRWRWINTKLFTGATILIIPALILTQTRAGLLALVIAVGYLLGRKHYKLIVVGTIISTLIIYINTTTRYLEYHGKSLPMIKQITSE